MIPLDALGHVPESTPGGGDRILHRDTVERTCEILRGRSGFAVFLIAGPGTGKTTLATVISERLSAEMTVVRLAGSPSMADVPYGVLAPYTKGLSLAEARSSVAVLRTLWKYFEDLKTGTNRSLLLVIDDAHHLDDATAGVVVDMISAGWASVLAVSRPRPGLPQALNQLWYDGLAERIDVLPLNQPQAAEAISHVLGGAVTQDTIGRLWIQSGGDAVLLDCLVNDAVAARRLIYRNGVWLLVGPVPPDGERVRGVVNSRMLHCTAEEQQALKLIALAEPLQRSLVEEMFGADVVRALRELQLVKESTEAVAELRLWFPAFGNALRSMVPDSLSRELRQQLAVRWGDRPVTGESLVRLVSWSVHCGLEVPDDQLLKASLLVSRDYQDDLALDLAARIHDPVIQRRASGIMARALFDQGRVEEASNLIEQHIGQADPADRLGGILLWAATRAALGQNPKGLAGVGGSGPGAEAVLELMAMSMKGAYPALAAKLDEFGSSEPHHDEHASTARLAFTAGMRSEVLRAAGRSESAQRIAEEGRKLLETSDHQPLFLTEFLLRREVGAALDAGNWPKTENLLSSFAEFSEGSMATFGGWLQSQRGLALIMQGRLDQGLRCLLPAIESLSERDPQLTLPLTIAAAAFAAARKGEGGLAGTLLLRYRQLSGGSLCGLDHATACIFEAAARDLLERRSAEGPERLRPFAAPSSTSSATCQLLALSLSVDMGCREDLLQIAKLTEDMEGIWAAAWNTYANAYIAAAPEAYLTAGEFLRDAGMIRLARESFAEASALFAGAGNKRGARVAAAQRDDCGEELRTETRSVSAVSAANSRLTRRELDIVMMAIQGLTDRQIAERLMVSVRTVEAHLYRSYAKLGIRGREQLSNVIRS